VSLAIIAVAGALSVLLLGRGPGGIAGLGSIGSASPSASVAVSASASDAPATATPDTSEASGPPATEPPSASASASPPTAPRSVAPSRPRVHIVRPGDWLSTIAAEYDTTVERLLELNDIKEPDVIEVGQEIVLPPEP
jgi:LysM repeat protein